MFKVSHQNAHQTSSFYHFIYIQSMLIALFFLASIKRTPQSQRCFSRQDSSNDSHMSNSSMLFRRRDEMMKWIYADNAAEFQAANQAWKFDQEIWSDDSHFWTLIIHQVWNASQNCNLELSWDIINSLIEFDQCHVDSNRSWFTVFNISVRSDITSWDIWIMRSELSTMRLSNFFNSEHRRHQRKIVSRL